MSLGQNIKRFRKEKKLTQAKLGEAIGKKEITIRKYESDNIAPSIELIEKIAKELDISFFKLIDGSTLEMNEVEEPFAQFLKELGFRVTKEKLDDGINKITCVRICNKENGQIYVMDKKSLDELYDIVGKFTKFQVEETLKKSGKPEDIATNDK
jgi:transcriptional regulator with XRE-family HTH domain